MPSNVCIIEITIEKFKKIHSATLKMAPTNVLVGGNNSGKSSVLQGIHFSVCAAVAGRVAGRDTFAQGDLLYCPAREFVSLRHGEAYLNQSNFGYFKVNATIADGEPLECNVRIYRGRNEGNVGCLRWGSSALGQIISNPIDLFSIYVPGLAGIPQIEEFRTEAVVRRGVAGGDANMYLRNVLLLIKQQNKLARLLKFMKTVFPAFWIDITFNPKADVYIIVSISTTGAFGHKSPIELAGTGVLQALQIFSYVTLFEPSLLLLDEPDAHLHPDNQGLLAIALQTISKETTTQVIISTHSRHLLDALQDEANFIWLKDGRVFKQGTDLEKLPLLLDLGALDTFDKLQDGKIDWVVLTEDAKTAMIKQLLDCSGFDSKKCLVYTYQSSTNIGAALILCLFIKDIKPNTHVIIHRDRDFMIDAEVEIVKKKIEEAGGIAFITEGSDLEDYFLKPKHIADLVGAAHEDVKLWIDELALNKHNDLVHSFSRKRDEIKYSIYRNKLDSFPSTLGLIGAKVPLHESQRLGKTMLKAVRAGLYERFSSNSDLLEITDELNCDELGRIKRESGI